MANNKVPRKRRIAKSQPPKGATKPKKTPRGPVIVPKRPPQRSSRHPRASMRMLKRPPYLGRDLDLEEQKEFYPLRREILFVPEIYSYFRHKQRPTLLMDAFAKRGWGVHWVVPDQVAEAAGEEKLEGINLYPADRLEEIYQLHPHVTNWTMYPGCVRAPYIGHKGLWVFDYVDDFPEQREAAEASLKMADVVFCTADALVERALEVRDQAVLLPNGVDIDAYDAEKRNPENVYRGVPHPRIGYMGALGGWFDANLIMRVARARPSWSFVILGFFYGGHRISFDRYPNIHYLGEVPYHEIPLYLKGLDIGIIPFMQGPVADACDPCKMYQYWAAGLPVVATKMREVQKFSPPYAYVASDTIDFVDACEAALEYTSPEIKQNIIDLARQNTWDERAKEAVKHLDPPYTKMGLSARTTKLSPGFSLAEQISWGLPQTPTKEIVFLPGIVGGYHDRVWCLAQELEKLDWVVHSNPKREEELEIKPGSVIFVSLGFPYASSAWNTGEGIFVLDCPTLPQGEEEWELVRSADIVVCASGLIRDEVSKRRGNRVLLLRNSAHQEQEAKELPHHIPEKSVLLLGAPEGYTDWGLVREVATDSGFSVVIALEGGYGERPPENIVELTKVLFLGSVSSQALAGVIPRCAAGIIPLKVEQATDMYDDPRGYICWSYQLPVVSTATTEMRMHPDGHVSLVEEPKQFVEYIKKSVQHDNKWRRNARAKRMSQEPWSDKACQLSAYLAKEYGLIAHDHTSGKRRSKPALHVVVLTDDPLVNRGVVPMLEAHGYLVTLYDLLNRELGEGYLEEIRRDMRDIGPQIVFAPSFFRSEKPGLEWPRVIKACKDSRAKFIWWEIEDPLVTTRPRENRNYYQAAATADLVLTPDPSCIPQYKNRGIQALPFMFAFPVEGWERYREKSHPEYPRCEAVLIANYYGYHSNRKQQQEMIASVARDFDLKIYGRLWEKSPSFSELQKMHKVSGGIPHEHLPAAMDSADIVLGMHIVTNSAFQTSMRTYETMGNGSFYLTFDTPAHQALFRPDKDYVGWKTTDELKKKLHFYLQNEDQRREIAANGARTIHASHTYAHRWRVVEEYIKSWPR